MLAKVMHAAPDLFISRIAGLEVFAGIVFRGLEPLDGDALQIHLSVHADLRALSGNYLAIAGEVG